MNKKIHLFFLGMIAFVIASMAQERKTALVKGKLQNASDGGTPTEVQITIPYLRMLTTSDGNGNFSFSGVPYGPHKLIIGGSSVNPDTISISVSKELVDLGTLDVTYNDAATSAQTIQIPTIAIDDNDGAEDENGGSIRVSSVLAASRDPFLNTAAYIFGTYHFQTRGYDRTQQQVLINGMPMNDIETGDVYWSQWGGLNDVFRGRSNTYGLKPSDDAYGGINGVTAFDATAANQRKQTRITYSLANRQYRNRFMITHSSGFNKNGWAYSLSFSKRWAQEGYIPGTFYDGYSYFAALTKRINNKHDINLTVFGAPTKRGKQGPSFGESYDILDTHYYNPNWGYQNGEKRNAKVSNIHQPVILLNYEYNPSFTFKWNTTIGYQFGKNSNSTLDWYNAPDPRPDYYKMLPSYYTNNNPNYQGLTTEQVNELTESFKTHSQIRWDELYQANQMNVINIPNPDGTVSSQTGKRALYMVGADVDAIKKYMFNTTLQKSINEHITVNGGISATMQNTESYRQMLDLLGADFAVNINSFTERNFAGEYLSSQNDMNHPNQLIKAGDKYYYDYKIHFFKAWAWAQGNFTYNKFDFFLAGNYGINSFQREGLFKNALFADESYGKSPKQRFGIYGIKGGATYKINGRHYLFINAAYAADAPTVDNTYFSARVRNTTVNDPKVQKTTSVEGGYLHRSPKTNVRLVGYLTDRKDGVEVQSYFYTGTGSGNSMVRYVMQNVNTRYAGIEFAVDYKFNSSFSATAVAAIGQAFYTSNPTSTIHYENNIDSTPFTETSYLNNKYLGVGPQSAYTIGLNYRSKKYWYLNANFNYFERNYVDPAGSRRTEQVLELVPENSALWHQILDQEELAHVFTIDIFGGKSFLLSKAMKFLPRNTYLYLNVGINNLLNNKNVPTGGFENMRYDYTGGDPSKFASKYFYGYGRNYFINLSLKF